MTTCVGTRVLRGPDWEGGDTDGGEGYLGTLTALLGNQQVRVRWDNGTESTCRAGTEGKFDLRIFDTASAGIRHAGAKCSSCGEENILGILWRCQECPKCDLCTPCYSDDKHDTRHQFLRIDTPNIECRVVPKRKTSVKVRAIGLFPGATVTRSKDWKGGDQGVGQGVVKGYARVARDSARNFMRVDWPNGVSSNCSVGYQGHVDLVFVEEAVGPFYYRDHLPLVDVSKCADEVIVSRPGTANNLAAILHDASIIHSPQLSSTPTAHGDNSSTGSVDTADKGGNSKTQHGQAKLAQPRLKLLRPPKQAAEPSAGQSGPRANKVNPSTEEQAAKGQSKEEEIKMSGACSEISCLEVLGVGDKVAITVGEERLKELQKTCGGCTAKMVNCIGRTGEVTSVCGVGVVSVKFGHKTKVKYRFNPAALVKIPVVQVGDTVRIKPSLEQVKFLNNRVGWKDQMDATVGKVGRVAKIDDEGDLHVRFQNCQWIYAPACCTPVAQPPDNVPMGEGATGNIVSLLGKTSACPSKTLDLFKMLRDRISSESDPQASCMRALWAAIDMGNDADVRDMCQRDTTIIEREFQGITPLIYASLRGQRACVTTLLDLGADVNKCGDNPRKTPMSAVLEGKSEEIAELLLERGAHANFEFLHCQTSVHLAATRNKAVCIRALAKYGADMNVKDAHLNTPLHIAVAHYMQKAMAALVSLPQVDIDMPDMNDLSPIQLASLRGNTKALDLLLARDRSGVERLREGHSSALFIAAQNDHVECVRLLVINGADVSRVGGHGMTALHIACGMANLSAVEALLELGADVNVPDRDGDTALHVAIGGKSDKAEVEVACRVQIGNMLISRGAYVDAENNKGRHPFLYGRTQVREGITTFMKNNREIVKTKKGTQLDFMMLSSQNQSTDLKQTLKGIALPCGVCGAPKSDVTLKPCLHKCVCNSCKEKVEQCPLCDEPVTGSVLTGDEFLYGGVESDAETSLSRGDRRRTYERSSLTRGERETGAESPVNDRHYGRASTVRRRGTTPERTTRDQELYV